MSKIVKKSSSCGQAFQESVVHKGFLTYTRKNNIQIGRVGQDKKLWFDCKLNILHRLNKIIYFKRIYFGAFSFILFLFVIFCALSLL